MTEYEFLVTDAGALPAAWAALAPRYTALAGAQRRQTRLWLDTFDARLHNAGLAHSDLSPNNVLVAPTQGKSIVIDVDSLVVEGLFPPDVAGQFDLTDALAASLALLESLPNSRAITLFSGTGHRKAGRR